MTPRALASLALTAAVLSAAPARSQEQRSPWSDPQFTWGIVAVSAGAAMIATGGYFLATSADNQEQFDTFRKDVNAGDNACDAAEEQGRDDIVDYCEERARNHTLGLILIPLGVASVGTGIVLLATRDPDPAAARRPAPRVSLHPELGPDTASLRLKASF